ncbi:MAG: glycosyltransferase family 4 protein [Ignavibacteriaceae bacterium]
MAKSKNSILFLSVMDSWGGGEEVLLKIALHVDGALFWVATPPGVPAKKFIAHKLNVFSLASLKKIYRDKNGWTIFDKLKVLTNIVRSLFPLYFFMRRRDITTIAANGNFAALFALPLVILFKKKLIVIQHLLYEKNSFEGRLLKVLVKYADSFICVSKSVSENIIKFTGEKSRSKFVIIYNGLSLPKRIDEPLGSHVSRDVIRFAVVGSIIPEKGHELILEAFCEVVSNYPECRLLILGVPREEINSKSFYQHLIEKTENLKLNDSVYFKGYLEEKSELYNQFDVLINYSAVPESFSMAVLEALAYNKIVIASNEGGPREIIEHNVNGFLVEPRNKEALIKMMRQVVFQFENNSMYEIRNNGQLTVEEKFSLQRFVDSYKNIFKINCNESK